MRKQMRQFQKKERSTIPGGPERIAELKTNWRRSQPSQELQGGPSRHGNRKNGALRQEELGRKTFLAEAYEKQGKVPSSKIMDSKVSTAIFQFVFQVTYPCTGKNIC